MTQKIYNIIRFKRIKHNSHISNTTSHNFRTNLKIKNVDYTKTDENIYLIGDNNTNLNDEFNKLKNRYKFKFIKDNFNMYDEFVISASPALFNEMTREQQIQYFKDNIDILQKHFFKVQGSVVSAVIHFDESTPHCHVVACPIVMDTTKKIARGKDKGKVIEGEFYSLSHERILGKKQQCRDLQTIFHRELNKMGWEVERGKQNTGIKHTELKEFNQTIKDFKNTQRSTFRVDKELRDFDDLNIFQKLKNLPKLTVKIQSALNTINKHYKAFKAVLRENKELKKQNDQLKNRLDNQATTKAEIKQNFDARLSKFKNVAVSHVKKLEQEKQQAEQELNQEIIKLEQEREQLQQDMSEVKSELNEFYEVIHSNQDLHDLFFVEVDKKIENNNQKAHKINFKLGF